MTDMQRMAEALYGRGKDYGYGKRPDGSFKGPGFLGPLRRPDGDVMTEYSIGVKLDGKETDIPTLVPTLSDAELNALLKAKPGERIPDSIVKKAVDHARKRMADGKSPFFGPDDED